MQTSMLPYVKDREPAEFERLSEAVRLLLSTGASDRAGAEAELVTAGAGAVAPIASWMESSLDDDALAPEDLEAHSSQLASLVERIGPAALPELERLLDDGRCDPAVDEWCQVLVFRLLRLEGQARQAACRHLVKAQMPWRGGTAWRCVACGARFGFGELPWDAPAGKGGRRGRGRRGRGKPRG